MGICDTATGTCICRTGFTGAACERMECGSACNGRGTCESMKNFAIEMDPGAGSTYSYTAMWDSEMMHGCSCDDGFSGYDCSLFDCPSGDDPLTTTDDAGVTQANEVQQVTCTATDGTFTLTFRGFTTGPISYDATSAEVTAAIEALPSISSDYESGVSVGYSGITATACTSGGHAWTVEFLQDFNDLPLLVEDDSNLTPPAAIDPMVIVEVTAGTKEDDVCSNRGICDTKTGSCTCETGYDTGNGLDPAVRGYGQRGDCGYVTQTITSCVGEIQCSGHGTCSGDPTYRCECNSGWTGATCADRLCPQGRPWFAHPTATDEAHLDTDRQECSNRGTCDRTTGLCVCDANFEGSACNLLSCMDPGDGVCNNKGQCLSLEQLAELAEVNGDAAGFSYGQVPNSVQTWDYEMIQGCYCEDGYMGYDCTQRSCAYGDDPLTIGQVNEVQQISCQDAAMDGTFQLTFRQQQTVTISVGDTIADVQAALEALTTITSVTVAQSSPSATGVSICSASGVSFTVEFLYPTSDVPDMTISSVSIDSISLIETLKGTKEYDECSNRGICDRETGDCTCFDGFGASDGQGNDGSIANCGHVEPIVDSEAVERLMGGG